MPSDCPILGTFVPTSVRRVRFDLLKAQPPAKKKNPLAATKPSYISSTRYLPLLPSGPDGIGHPLIAYGLVINAKGVRRERDSNPRYPDRVHTLSKRAPSASRSSLLLLRFLFMVTDGESGIRTHGAALRLNGFRVRPIQPLSHLSMNNVPKRTRTSGL